MNTVTPLFRPDVVPGVRVSRDVSPSICRGSCTDGTAKSTAKPADKAAIAAKPTSAEILAVLDSIAASFLERNTDDSIAGSALDLTPDMIRHYRRFYRDGSNGARPRSSTIIGMCLCDAYCMAMLLDLLGYGSGRSPAVEAAIDNLLKAERAAAIAASVTEQLDQQARE